MVQKGCVLGSIQILILSALVQLHSISGMKPYGKRFTVNHIYYIKAVLKLMINKSE